MIGQQKISSFFKSITTKKHIPSPTSPFDNTTHPSCGEMSRGIRGNRSTSTPSLSPTKPAKRTQSKKPDEETPAKRKCLTDDEQQVGDVQLSPEQKQRVDGNKLTAKMKLAETNSHGLLTDFGSSWFKALEPEFSKQYFTKLSSFVQKERQNHTIYPPANQVFSWTKMCDVNDVKVVILGQDPYHGPKQAHGLCFSVQNGVTPPPSLVNMYKLLEKDIDGFKRPTHGNLTGWAEQGVLLLNACLTVRASQANSHKDQGWEKFTDAVIRWLNNNLQGVVFLLWGSYAQKKGACIDKKKHHVLTAVHPSPLSAHRGFFDCGHFSKTNDLLQKQGDPIIDWTRLSNI